MASKTPWSSKIQCTLQAQVPELFERISSLVEAIKKEGVKESKEKSEDKMETEKKESEKQTTATIRLGQDDELSVKVLKKQK
eukprot:4363451-Amphidinium_carterae.1